MLSVVIEEMCDAKIVKHFFAQRWRLLVLKVKHHFEQFESSRNCDMMWTGKYAEIIFASYIPVSRIN